MSMLSRTIRLATTTRTTTPFLTSTSTSTSIRLRHYTPSTTLLASNSNSTPTHTSNAPKSPPTHTTDTYSKEIDSTPAPDPQIHRIDPGSDKVQKPYEPPSGEFSQAGVETGEYQSVYKIGDVDGPYEVDGGGEGEGKGKEGEEKGKEGAEEKLRYGGKERLGKEQRQSGSHAGEGPEGEDAGGRGA